MSEQICRFCHKYVQLTYYCEECGSSCCSDCLHETHDYYDICQECNSRKIDSSNSDKRKVCKDCGSENIVKGSQLIKSCPKCNSHNIVNIYEKKEELEKRFLELIKNTRLFVEPLREMINKLNILKQKLEKARAPPMRYYHYPKMESDLLALFKLFQYVQNTLYEKINVHYHQLDQNQEYFFDTYAQPNSNITIIEGLFENLVRSYDSINLFITNNINAFESSIESILANLQFINRLNFYFDSYKKVLNLAEREKPVFAINAKLSNGLDTKEKYKKDRGILFITNFDLSFVHEHGFFKKKKELIFKAPVGDLTRIKEKGKIFKKLYIQFAYGKYEFSLPPKSVSRVIEYILLARTFDETTVYDKKTALRVQRINCDLGDLETFIEESINNFFSIKCQYNKSSEKAQNYINTNSTNNNNIIPNQMHNCYPNISYNPNFNNGNFPGNMGGYNGNVFPQPNQPNGVYPSESSNQIYPPRNNTQSFFRQNVSNPNCVQNYVSHQIPGYHSEFSNTENRNFLIRKLNKQNQNLNDNYINQFKSLNRNEYGEEPRSDNHKFHDFNKNHLTELFSSDENPSPSRYRHKIHPNKPNEGIQERMLELNKERYSLKKTVSKLDTKFDQGIISEVDYFKTYKNLQKEFYLIETEIQSLKERIEDSENFI